MEEVKELLKIREKQLMHLKSEKEKALKKAPDGLLRVCNRKKKAQYYHRKNSKDIKGVYIREKDIKIAQALAQKDYDRRVLRATEKELNAISHYLSGCPEKNAEQIYGTLHKERQKLIYPILESDEEYIKSWESVEYQGKGFYEDVPELRTMKGERVRSKSEIIIADLLNRESIPYRYEYPVHLDGVGRIYPDFTVLNVRLRKEIYWEHLGMMDNPEYAEKAVQKIASYVQNGIFPGENLILTYETAQNPISSKMIMTMIERYLK